MGLCPPFPPWAQCSSQHGTVHWARGWTLARPTQQGLTSPDQASFALMAYGAATPGVTLSQTARMAGKGTHLLPDRSRARGFTSCTLVHTTVTGRSEHGTFRLLLFELAKLHKNESGTNRGPALAGTGEFYPFSPETHSGLENFPPTRFLL